MSENNNNQQPSAGGEKRDQQNGKERSHRYHRHRRPQHNNKGQRPKSTEQKPEEAKSQPAAEPSEQQQNAENNKKKQRNGQRKDRGGRGQTQGNRGGNRFGLEKRPFDPYEQPSREEIALSKLRAQIVLQSADGSVPTAYGEPVSAPPVSSSPVPVNPAENGTDSTVPSDTPAMDMPAEPSEPAAEIVRVEVVGVRFRAAGKTYYFDPHGLKAKKGENAIVETSRGPEFGEVYLENTLVNQNNVVLPLRPLIRIATDADVAHNAENREKEQQALKICQERIAAHKLEMKLIDVQYAFDNSKLLFYFAAEGRVDFRELVKDLASIFRTRIELRQIGIRDEAKMLGGIGACGRALCCSTFLPDFAQVSIKMAKDQNLSLNANKISGICGRLMCCLRYESEVYAEEIRKTPPFDSTVRTEDGIGTVIGSNPLAGTVRVVLKDSPESPPKQYHRDQVVLLPKERRSNNEPKNDKKDSES